MVGGWGDSGGWVEEIEVGGWRDIGGLKDSGGWVEKIVVGGWRR